MPIIKGNNSVIWKGRQHITFFLFEFITICVNKFLGFFPLRSIDICVYVFGMGGPDMCVYVWLLKCSSRLQWQNSKYITELEKLYNSLLFLHSLGFITFLRQGKQTDLFSIYCCIYKGEITYLAPCFPPLFGFIKMSNGCVPGNGVIWNEPWNEGKHSINIILQ